jgi:hypothetical protein
VTLGCDYILLRHVTTYPSTDLVVTVTHLKLLPQAVDLLLRLPPPVQGRIFLLKHNETAYRVTDCKVYTVIHTSSKIKLLLLEI